METLERINRTDERVEYYRKIIQNSAKKFKPVIAKLCNTDLEDIIVRYSSSTFFHSMYYTTNEIIFTPFYFYTGEDEVELDVVHELGHHVTYALNYRYFGNFLNDLPKSQIIGEGFCEHLSLNLFPTILLSEKVIKRKKEDLHEDKDSPHAIGYRFFTIITRILGNKEAFEIIKNPNVFLDELENPKLYIDRRKNGNLQKKQ